MPSRKLFALSLLFAVWIGPWCREDAVPQVQDGAVRQAWRVHLADSLCNLGYSKEPTNPLKAESLYVQALSLVAGTGDSVEANALENLAAVLEKTHPDSAVTFLERSLLIRRTTRDREGEGASLSLIGDAYYYWGRYRESDRYLDSALAVARALQATTFIGNAMTTIGRNDIYLGSYGRSIGILDSALMYSTAAGDSVGLAAAYTNLGYAYFGIGKPGPALVHLTKALDIYRAMGNREYTGVVYGVMALVYNGQHRYSRALSALDSALAIALDLHIPLDEAITRSKFGLVYLTSKQYNKAISELTRALSLFQELNATERIGTVYYRLMMAQKGLKKYSQAIFYGKLAVNAYQSVRTHLKEFDPATQHDFVKSKEQAYRVLAGLLLDRKRFAEAEQIISMLKEEEYFDFVRGDKAAAASLSAIASLTPEEKDFFPLYNRKIDSLGYLGREWRQLRGKSALTQTETIRYSQLDSIMRASKFVVDQVLAGLERESPKRGVGPKDIREAANLIDLLKTMGDGCVALYTVVSPEKYYLFLISPSLNDVASTAIPAGRLDSLVIAFRDAIPYPRRKARVDSLATVLYKILFAPLSSRLEGLRARTLMWMLDGSLRYLPINALYDGKHYLVERFRSVVMTEGSAPHLLGQDRKSGQALGLGVSKPHEGFDTLRGARAELMAIIRDSSIGAVNGIVAGHILLDERFTRKSIEPVPAGCSIVHIASHFKFERSDALSSFLLLGDGSHLTLQQIKAMSRPFEGVDMLVLSGCNTAYSGLSADGRDIENLGVIAQQQGARSVIATLWPISDTSCTPLLMRTFYRLRQENPKMSKAEALRQAQISFLNRGVNAKKPTSSLLATRGGNKVAARAADSQYSHPYYWAPFILIGNWK